jgi:hypothetical protein
MTVGFLVEDLKGKNSNVQEFNDDSKEVDEIIDKCQHCH